MAGKYEFLCHILLCGHRKCYLHVNLKLTHYHTQPRKQDQANRLVTMPDVLPTLRLGKNVTLDIALL